MNSIRIAFAASLAAVSAAASAQLTLPITDTFPSSGPQQQWEDYADVPYNTGKVVAYNPTAPGGDGFALDVNDGSGHGAVYLTNDTGNLSDYKITAYVHVPSSDGTNWGRVGIIARAQADSAQFWRPKGYYIILDTDGNNYLRFVAFNNTITWPEPFAVSSIDTAEYPNAPVTGTYAHPGWHKLELEVTGTTIKAEINDTVIATATSSLYSSGRIAIYNYRATGTAPSTFVDRITIEPTSTSNVADWAMY